MSFARFLPSKQEVQFDFPKKACRIPTVRMLLKALRKALQKLIAPSMEEDIFQAAAAAGSRSRGLQCFP